MTKKLLLISVLIAMLSFTSCGFLQPYTESSYIADYYKYTAQGFFITESNSVNFEYEPVGSISVVAGSGFVKATIPKETPTPKEALTVKKKPKSNKLIYRDAVPEDAIRMLYERAKAVEADGIINVKVQSRIIINANKYIYPERYIVIEASAMAIKRLHP
jgi:hypothetical protein